MGLAVDVRDANAIVATADLARASLPSICGVVHCVGIVDTSSQRHYERREVVFPVRHLRPDFDHDGTDSLANVGQTVFASGMP